MAENTLKRSAQTLIYDDQTTWFERHGSTLLTYFCFFIFVLVIGFPFYYIFISSVAPRDELFQIPPRYIPSSVSIDSYTSLLDAVPFLTYLRNSLIFSVGSSVVSVIFSALAAYALSRISFRGRNLIYIALILSVALPQIAVMVPLFQTLQVFKMVNTHHGLVLLMSSLMLPFTIMTFVSFINQVPGEIEEAALIDGASRLAVIVRIVFPLIRPAMVTMLIINFIISWNELLYPLIFAQRTTTKTLSVGLLELSSDASTYTRPWDTMSAMSIVMIIPVLILILVGQRSIISGLTRGAVK